MKQNKKPTRWYHHAQHVVINALISCSGEVSNEAAQVSVLGPELVNIFGGLDQVHVQ